MHWPRPITPLTVCKRNLKEARHHQEWNLQEAGSVRTADARFAGLAVPNVAGRTTAAPWTRGAVMAINACGRKKKKRCIDGYKVESCISGCVLLTRITRIRIAAIGLDAYVIVSAGLLAAGTILQQHPQVDNLLTLVGDIFTQQLNQSQKIAQRSCEGVWNKEHNAQRV